jgi:hypothetical protein
MPDVPEYHDEIEQFIREAFEENYTLLQLEGAGYLAADVRQAALEQALLYWRKLRDVAESITDTEVKLNLPCQITPQGREFTIEGIVDIVREQDETVMYDIKTHEADFVRANREQYEKQLSVYTHIWRELRGQALDRTAVIATTHPRRLKDALLSGNKLRIEHEIKRWEPVVEIPLDQASVEETLSDFGAVVDQIEDRRFAPPPVEYLKERMEVGETRFATVICRNCDARFSCSSYRAYALESTGRVEQRFRAYYRDSMTDQEREEWLNATLDAAPDTTALEELL